MFQRGETNQRMCKIVRHSCIIDSPSAFLQALPARKHKFHACCPEIRSLKTIDSNCEDAATREGSKNDPNNDRYRQARSEKRVELCGFCRLSNGRRLRSRLETLMTFFQQKRGKFENLVFPYGTFEKERVTILMIARLRWRA